MPEQFISQLLVTSEDEQLKNEIRKDYQSVTKLLQLYREWNATKALFDSEEDLFNPPGCFQN